MIQRNIAVKLAASGIAATLVTGCVSTQTQSTLPSNAYPQTTAIPSSASIPANMLRKTQPGVRDVYMINQTDGTDFLCLGTGTQGQMVDNVNGIYIAWAADKPNISMAMQVYPQPAVIVKNYKSNASAFVLNNNGSLAPFVGNDSKEMQAYLNQLKRECDYGVNLAVRNGIGVGESVTLSGEFSGIVIRRQPMGEFLSYKHAVLSSAAALPIVTRPAVYKPNLGNGFAAPRY